MNKETVIKLEKFLKNHRAYSRFMSNTRKNRGLEEEESLTLTNIVNSHRNSLGETSLISCAFVWEYTFQGHSYWERLSKKWRESLG